MSTLINPSRSFSDQARQRLQDAESGPFLLSDWLSTLMVHYQVAPAVLQPLIPFELDLDPRGGRAYVSLVMFNIQRLRPNVGGRLLEWASNPCSNHSFLNVRTYVRHEGEPGIYFMAEWLDNRLSRFIGNKTFGLPYRYGRLDYEHQPELGRLAGQVTGTPGSPAPGSLGDPAAPQGELRYLCAGDPITAFSPCEPGSLDEFLMERYTAFTCERGIKRLFRIWHEPWQQAPVGVAVADQGLLATTGPWPEHARIVGAQFSPGVRDVWVGRPRCIQGPACGRLWPGTEP